MATTVLLARSLACLLHMFQKRFGNDFESIFEAPFDPKIISWECFKPFLGCCIPNENNPILLQFDVKTIGTLHRCLPSKNGLEHFVIVLKNKQHFNSLTFPFWPTTPNRNCLITKIDKGFRLLRQFNNDRAHTVIKQQSKH